MKVVIYIVLKRVWRTILGVFDNLKLIIFSIIFGKNLKKEVADHLYFKRHTVFTLVKQIFFSPFVPPLSLVWQIHKIWVVKCPQNSANAINCNSFSSFLAKIPKALFILNNSLFSSPLLITRITHQSKPSFPFPYLLQRR